MTDREKFEAWADTKRCDLTKWSRGEKAGQYKNPVVEKMCEAWQAALASQNDGWIEWNGGYCPVPSKTLVVVRYRKGKEESAGAASGYHWNHETGICAMVDIVAYKVVKS